MSRRYKVRVWKVTEYDVTLDVEQGDDVLPLAISMAAKGHTTDYVNTLGVMDRGTFPVIREFTLLSEEMEK